MSEKEYEFKPKAEKPKEEKKEKKTPPPKGPTYSRKGSGPLYIVNE